MWREAGNYLKEIVCRLTIKVLNTFVLATIANARCALIGTNSKLAVQLSQGMILAVTMS